MFLHVPQVSDVVSWSKSQRQNAIAIHCMLWYVHGLQGQQYRAVIFLLSFVDTQHFSWHF